MDIQRDILPLKDTMFRLAMRITQNRQEAEDVVQDVVIKLWHSRETLADVDNLEAYAMRMVHNTAISRTRLKANNTESLEAVTEQPATSADSLEQRERIDSIRAIMNLLPEAQRTAMHLRDFEGYSYKEIAQMTDLTEEQVKVYIFRARQFVKTRIGGMLAL